MNESDLNIIKTNLEDLNQYLCEQTLATLKQDVKEIMDKELYKLLFGDLVDRYFLGPVKPKNHYERMMARRRNA